MDEVPQLIFVGVWFVTRVDKLGILLEDILSYIRRYILSGWAAERSNRAFKCLLMFLPPAFSVFVLERGK